MSNRRRQYRVTERFDELVQIELLGPKVHARNVVLQDLSAGGAGIVLPKTASGMLRLRDRIELHLISPKLSNGPVRMHAKVCHLDERGLEPKVGISFESWREHRVLLDSELRSLFNEREAFRVEPGLDPILVEVLARAGRVRLMGRLRDVSVLGLGVQLPLEATERLRVGMSVMLRFALPGSSEVIEAPCQVRHMRVDGSLRRSGIGFRMADGVRMKAEHRRSVRDFVMLRQRELLRMGVRLDEPGARAVRSGVASASA